MIVRIGKAAIGAAVVAMAWIILSSQAQAANCGGVNQRACKLWERVPSCNKGLTELVRPGYCSRPPRVTKPAFNCGALGQKPCAVLVRVPSCDAGLVEDFVRNQCVKKSNVDSLAAVGQACYNSLKTVAVAMVPVAECVARLQRPDRLMQLFEARDVGAVTARIVQGACKPQIDQAASVLRANGLASMSLGLGGEVGAFIGATSEFFLAINTDLSGRAYIYETLGYKFGKFAGGSINGIVTAHRGDAGQLAGDGQAISLSFKALGGAGFSAGFSYANGAQDPNCTSLSVAAGAGAEANAGSINRFTTPRLTN